ncbi:hypothetical protein E2C01_085914 [Portunus trituberculatus]|uniref:Uncharacterized protein n=1 Tax=Portunus trituberculatus TaxID=210409 RepID=A0A5B7J2B4_PORTR|nr:hypothetical protein [Portunus trituberculatus]
MSFLINSPSLLNHRILRPNIAYTFPLPFSLRLTATILLREPRHPPLPPPFLPITNAPPPFYRPHAPITTTTIFPPRHNHPRGANYCPR